ncbi:FecR family protein [Croceimicrobium hydrocarbonivorans]|uniref:FecR domain-containing protein n=1 Tax=Croceimicrobium hydrocarbonivorans TaxID=2761580 RepID=A0A7H0VD68_9FLAO|nr:FecR domain-containing protein [Croceimicrobium hydrocarbonivorans]QNR23666.1 FecR domain-containing protein [Croceimicrobium hydrocarbonivorans]
MRKTDLEKVFKNYSKARTSDREERNLAKFFAHYEKQVDESAVSDSYRNEMLKAIEAKIDGRTGKVRRLFPEWLKVAASVMILIAMAYGSFQIYDSQKQIQYAMASTERGQKTTLTLSDGSLIYLNAESSLKYPEFFNQDHREVWLEGEAFFEVARDESRPFIIHSQHAETTVLGTSFTVSDYADSEASVTVSTGKVRVFSAQLDSSLILVPNDRLILREQNMVLSQVNAAEQNAWYKGILRFDGARLESLVPKLERWYAVDFIVEDPELLNCAISGKFKNASLTSFLESLKFIHGLEYEFNDQDQVILKGKICK